MRTTDARKGGGGGRADRGGPVPSHDESEVRGRWRLAGVPDGRAPPGRVFPGAMNHMDFARPLDFTFLGRAVRGFHGDTVASALYAAGVRIFSRSLKYHRPRGLYSMEGESSNTYMEIDGVPNECAETTPLRAGMSVRAQNVRGDPRTDPFGLIDPFDRLLPAGFPYRLFHRPRRLWPLFRDGLRRMAGTGVLDPRRDHHRDGVRAERYMNADVAIVGGGMAGMEAALAASRRGTRVCLFERRPRLGGERGMRERDFQGKPLFGRSVRMALLVRVSPNVRVFTNSPVTGVWGENLVTGFTVGTEEDPFRECHWECRAKAVVVAAGCTDRPLVFNNNDRPGVMLPRAAWRLALAYGVRPGRVAVFSVGDDMGLEVAVDLADLGVEVRAVADARTARRQDPELVAALESRGIPVLPEWAASRAMGRRRVTGCRLRPLHGGGSRTFRCDLLVANAGRQPRIGTLATVKGKLAYCPHTHTFQPEELPQGVFAAGSMKGYQDPRAIESSGRLAGHRAIMTCIGLMVGPKAAASAWINTAPDQRAAAARPGPAPGCGIGHGPGIGRGAKAFVDLDEDGTYKNVRESVAQGFDAPELAKRFGGFGLGPGQHRVAGQNLAMIMAELNGEDMETVAPTTVRPPLSPPSLATLAGPGHDVHKRTPLHDELAARGAVFRRAGPWLRARHFGEDPRRDPEAARRAAEAVRREIRHVRRRVGILDSSPLGKFRIHGPDALRALQRVYISDMRKARTGRCMYSAMCNDMGNLIDDGVVVKDADGDYYFTTSTARAGSTVEWFRYHTRHDDWDYHLVNLTDALGSLNVAGPDARRLLERVTDGDVSNQAFPYMACRRIVVGDGMEARCLRLGFVGELSYELHVPSSRCRHVWDLLFAEGADLGVRPFGLEAQYCLRAEKGHVIAGAESEARVTLSDIGMGWLWNADDTASKKVGAPALRACAEQPGRMKLVGIRVDEGAEPPRDGALVVDGGEIVGHVCTTRRSEALGWRYGMALVREGHAGTGGRISIREEESPGRPRTCRATVVPPRFLDPAGKKVRG